MRWIAFVLLLGLCGCSSRSQYVSTCSPLSPSLPGPWVVTKDVEINEAQEYDISDYDDCPVEGCPWQVILHKGAKRRLAAESPETLRRIEFGQSLTLRDLRILSAQGFPDEVVFYHIDRTDTDMPLPAQQIDQLETWGVRPTIIEYLTGSQ